MIDIQDLPAGLLEELSITTSNEWIPVYIGESLAEVEKKLILGTLEHCKGNKRKTANIIGLSERQLHTKLKQYEAGKK